jgi:hypothetical protein
MLAEIADRSPQARGPPLAGPALSKIGTIGVPGLFAMTRSMLNAGEALQ